MSGDQDIQNLFKLRDALIELSGSMNEWLFQQRTLEGTLPVKEFNEILKSLGEGEGGESRRGHT
ncbi:hypothetical protein MCEMSHM24_03092 [Comamonadaceae bacterium]|jgi:hypothetical protein